MSALDFFDKYIFSPRLGMVLPGIIMVLVSAYGVYERLSKDSFPIYNITDKNVGMMVESDKLTAKLTDFDIPTRKLVKRKTRVISFKCEKVNCGLNRTGVYTLSHINYLIVQEHSRIPGRSSMKFNYFLMKLCVNNNCLTNHSDSLIQDQKDEYIYYKKLEVVVWLILTILSFFFANT